MRHKFPCSVCGSTNWPRPDTSCPCCYKPADEDEDDNYNDNEEPYEDDESD